MRGKDTAEEIIKLHRQGLKANIISGYIDVNLEMVQQVIQWYEKQEKNDERKTKGQDRR